jgi:hypothetical protein
MSVKGFNFLVNSFWVEVEEKIEQYIKSIFAPGDPVLFHKVYIYIYIYIYDIYKYINEYNV